jgi:hypothetical protein
MSNALFHLLDEAQLWYHCLEFNGGPSTWNRFVQLMNTRFSPLLTDNPISELVLLTREGSVDDYCNRNMALYYHDPSLTKS